MAFQANRSILTATIGLKAILVIMNKVKLFDGIISVALTINRASMKHSRD